MEEIIRIENLKKYFVDVKAVDDITFSVKKGSLFAFLGLNGAGKSTTINILCSILQKDSGRVEIAGLDLDRDSEKIRNKIGIVFQNSMLDRLLNVRDNLTVRAAFYGIYGAAWETRLTELSQMMQLEDLLRRPYGKLSGGQRRRVDVARSLIHAPEILILDEPTTGLDPSTRKTVWSIIDRLRKEKDMTVFLTTHYMEESNNAEHVVILDNGKVAADGTPVSLKNRYSRDYLYIYRERCEEADKAFAPYGQYSGNGYKLTVKDESAKAILKRYDALIDDFELKKGDMDDVFLNVTGKKLEA